MLNKTYSLEIVRKLHELIYELQWKYVDRVPEFEKHIQTFKRELCSKTLFLAADIQNAFFLVFQQISSAFGESDSMRKFNVALKIDEGLVALNRLLIAQYNLHGKVDSLIME